MHMIWLKENSIIVVFCQGSCLGKYAHSSFFQSYILTFSCISFNLVWLFVSFFFFTFAFIFLLYIRPSQRQKSQQIGKMTWLKLILEPKPPSQDQMPR